MMELLLQCRRHADRKMDRRTLACAGADAGGGQAAGGHAQAIPQRHGRLRHHYQVGTQEIWGIFVDH